MTDYQSPDDLKSIPAFVALAPVEANAFLAFNHAVERQDGLIPPKYRELISLAVALTTQCAYCLDVHTAQAAKAGATREEVAEAALIAAAVRAGGTLGHALLAQRLFERNRGGGET
ncbi:carboxymuconolactone decarboxylase family protein [Bradyrhizobium liaoningense]|uniref:carboxymuconolactone decarboxylase family protein n=1 Tax=Bradyrhizobium liaoningense TaxID=43992 RepID=UPI001BA5022A|nr:carboxymuconolactone decarboxylase family protein [Bradyrhizobium liaoningense]MBR0839268.1 carboxymuconolactone decarboxylase family protein [Bradyrhizobium liaoningense]MBR0860292.1 carboxymuconolactone decarboxylase family protein [Bradyrhizobium liaoningense]